MLLFFPKSKYNSQAYQDLPSDNILIYGFFDMCIFSPKDDHHELTDVDDTDAVTGHRKQNKWVKNIKIGILLVVWMIFTGILMSSTEKELEFRQMAVPEGQIKTYTLQEAPVGSRVGVILRGAFLPVHYSNLTENRLSIFVHLHNATAPVQSDNSSQVQDLSYYEVGSLNLKCLPTCALMLVLIFLECN